MRTIRHLPGRPIAYYLQTKMGTGLWGGVNCLIRIVLSSRQNRISYVEEKILRWASVVFDCDDEFGSSQSLMPKKFAMRWILIANGQG